MPGVLLLQRQQIHINSTPWSSCCEALGQNHLPTLAQSLQATGHRMVMGLSTFGTLLPCTSWHRPSMLSQSLHWGLKESEGKMRRCLQRCMNFVAIQELSLAGFRFLWVLIHWCIAISLQLNFSINGFAWFRGLNSTYTVLARSVHDLWRDQSSLSIVQVRPTLSIPRTSLNMRAAMIMWECESAWCYQIHSHWAFMVCIRHKDSKLCAKSSNSISSSSSLRRRAAMKSMVMMWGLMPSGLWFYV